MGTRESRKQRSLSFAPSRLGEKSTTARFVSCEIIVESFLAPAPSTRKNPTKRNVKSATFARQGILPRRRTAHEMALTRCKTNDFCTLVGGPPGAACKSRREIVAMERKELKTSPRFAADGNSRCANSRQERCDSPPGSANHAEQRGPEMPAREWCGPPACRAECPTRARIPVRRCRAAHRSSWK